MGGDELHHPLIINLKKKTKMTEEVRKLLKNWADTENGHPCDYERVYDIVIKTIDNKIGESDFKEVASEEKFKKYYSLYEHLVDFAKYYRKNEKNNC